MKRVAFAVAAGSAICPFDGLTHRFSAMLVLKRPVHLVKIEAVAAWVADVRECEASAECVARALATWGAKQGGCASRVTLTHEERQGVTLTVVAVA